MVSKKNRLLAPVYARMTCRLRFGLGKGGCKANGAFQKRKMCGCTPLPPSPPCVVVVVAMSLSERGHRQTL